LVTARGPALSLPPPRGRGKKDTFASSTSPIPNTPIRAKRLRNPRLRGVLEQLRLVHLRAQARAGRERGAAICLDARHFRADAFHMVVTLVAVFEHVERLRVRRQVQVAE